jgi:hypothetical protein
MMVGDGVNDARSLATADLGGRPLRQPGAARLAPACGIAGSSCPDALRWSAAASSPTTPASLNGAAFCFLLLARHSTLPWSDEVKSV